MKSGKILLTLLMSLGLAAVFSSCTVTGDPSRGGIFWSESMAQDRLNQRQAILNSVEADTARVNRRNVELEEEIDTY
jgi:hypothetical protein